MLENVFYILTVMNLAYRGTVIIFFVLCDSSSIIHCWITECESHEDSWGLGITEMISDSMLQCKQQKRDKSD